MERSLHWPTLTKGLDTHQKHHRCTKPTGTVKRFSGWLILGSPNTWPAPGFASLLLLLTGASTFRLPDARLGLAARNRNAAANTKSPWPARQIQGRHNFHRQKLSSFHSRSDDWGPWCARSRTPSPSSIASQAETHCNTILLRAGGTCATRRLLTRDLPIPMNNVDQSLASGHNVWTLGIIAQQREKALSCPNKCHGDVTARMWLHQALRQSADHSLPRTAL